MLPRRPAPPFGKLLHGYAVEANDAQPFKGIECGFKEVRETIPESGLDLAIRVDGENCYPVAITVRFGEFDLIADLKAVGVS